MSPAHRLKDSYLTSHWEGRPGKKWSGKSSRLWVATCRDCRSDAGWRRRSCIARVRMTLAALNPQVGGSGSGAAPSTPFRLPLLSFALSLPHSSPCSLPSLSPSPFYQMWSRLALASPLSSLHPEPPSQN